MNEDVEKVMIKANELLSLLSELDIDQRLEAVEALINDLIEWQSQQDG